MTLLTPEQVAERLQLKRRTVLEMLAEGGVLSHLRIEITPKVIRVRAESLEAHLTKAKQ